MKSIEMWTEPRKLSLEESEQKRKGEEGGEGNGTLRREWHTAKRGARGKNLGRRGRRGERDEGSVRRRAKEKTVQREERGEGRLRLEAESWGEKSLTCRSHSPVLVRSLSQATSASV